MTTLQSQEILNSIRSYYKFPILSDTNILNAIEEQIIHFDYDLCLNAFLDLVGHRDKISKFPEALRILKEYYYKHKETQLAERRSEEIKRLKYTAFKDQKPTLHIISPKHSEEASAFVLYSRLAFYGYINIPEEERKLFGKKMIFSHCKDRIIDYLKNKKQVDMVEFASYLNSKILKFINTEKAIV